jgi:endonuclease/exonuclease/phosphatase family metal-dependent hydrolase
MMTIKGKRVPRFESQQLILTLLFAAFFTAWTAHPTFARDPSRGKGNLRVLTYNVYEGADLTPAMDAKTREEFLTAIGAVVTNVQATNLPARAKAIARQIGKVQPTLVSLQEVTRWETCSATDDFTGCTTTPTLMYDMLDLVKGALEKQGYPYKEVARVTTNELRAPTITGSGPVLVLYAQRSVILVRADIDHSDLQISNIQSAQFKASLTIPSAIGPITIHRAWVSADVAFHGQSFRFIDTQLEAFDPNINYEQSEELLSGPAHTSKPVIVAMDSNSKANMPENAFTPTYHNFLQNGFRDVWTATQGKASGSTCCQDHTLMNPASTVSKRIDLILLRGGLDAKTVELFGGQLSDRTKGLWPSDHLEVVATLGTE